MDEWKQTLDQAIKNHKWQEIVELLEQDKTKHAGTAPAQIKRKAIKALLKQLKDKPTVLWEVTSYLGEQSSPTAKEISAHLIPEVYKECPKESAELLHKIADDENWEVREWAAGGCGELLAMQYEQFYPVVDRWKEDESENIRRAVVLAVMYASKTLKETDAPQLLQVLEPLMEDDSVYVKKNLGPFAIGDGLLKRYPKHVLPWLESLVHSEDEQVRWNVVMVFTAAAARVFYEEGEKILGQVEFDERKSIQRAIKKAERNLEKSARESVQ